MVQIHTMSLAKILPGYNVCLFSWSLIVRLQAGLIFYVIVVIVVVVRVFLAGTAVMGLMGEMVFLVLMATKDQRFVSFAVFSPGPFSVSADTPSLL